MVLFFLIAFSAKLLMTYPKTERDLLIMHPSFILSPVAYKVNIFILKFC